MRRLKAAIPAMRVFREWARPPQRGRMPVKIQALGNRNLLINKTKSVLLGEGWRNARFQASH